MKKPRQIITLGLLVALAPLALSCYGSFPMTRAVYRGNGNVYSSVPGDSTQRKFVQSVVMYVFLPVYAVAGVGDIVVFNLIEFWTGNRTTLAYEQESNGTHVSLASTGNGQEAVLTISREGKVLAQQHFVKTAEGRFEIRDAQGRQLGQVTRAHDGSLCLTDAHGATVGKLGATELASLQR